MSGRKTAKKQRRKETLLLKHQPELGVVFQQLSSAHVFIGNGGLSSGICRTMLEQVLSTKTLYMPPGKDYAFATFSSVGEAEKVVESLNGVCVQEVSGAVDLLPPCLMEGPSLHLYLSYVSAIPEQLVEGVPTSSPPLPSGLLLLENFISPSEEEELLAFLDPTHTSHAHMKHRQVLHYGYEFNYDTNHVDLNSPLPGEFPPLIQHMISRIASSGHVHHTPDQLTVNCYPPGAGIPPHVDTHSAFMEEIVSLSLGSQVVMDFRKGCVAGAEEKVSVLVPVRSLLVMKGAARYRWTHAIASRHYDQVPSPVAMTTVPRGTRVSLTFRTVRSPPTCKCEFPTHCDSQRSL